MESEPTRRRGAALIAPGPPGAVIVRSGWVDWALALGCTGLILLAPWPLAALAAAGLVLLSAVNPLPALAFTVLSLPFYLLGRPLGSYHFSPTELLIILSTLAAALRLVMRRTSWIREAGPPMRVRSVLGDPSIAVLITLIVLAGAISLTASIETHPSLQALRTVILEPAVFYFLVVTQVRRRQDLEVLVAALVLAGVLIALIGGWQYLENERIITAEDGLRRIRGFYGSPNNLGLFLGRVLPVTLALALWRDTGRLYWALAFVIVGVAQLLTFSIGGWVATLGALYIVTALRGRRALIIASLLAGLILALGALVAAEVPRIGSHFDLKSGTTFIRLGVWQSAVRMIQDHPIRGVGLDNFLYNYRQGYRLPSAWADPDLSHPHNLILDAWLSLGFVGPWLFGGLVGRLIQVIRRHWDAALAADRAIYAGVIGAVADTLIHGLVDNSFFLVDLAVLFWLMFAIVAVLQRLEEQPAS